MGSSLVDAALDGYNTVMFMYGQTSSGKTFTLFCDGRKEKGIVQHAVQQVHDRVTGSGDTEFVVKLTYAELYNEEIKDLLATAPNENLKIIDDLQMGPVIQNITEVRSGDMKAAMSMPSVFHFSTIFSRVSSSQL